MRTTLLTITLCTILLPFSAQARSLLVKDSQPRIQMAILLDTSSSMDGLIDQARNQLWEVVNEFSQAKRNGVKPSLEVAVYEYGNDNLHQQNGYIRQVTGFTKELDRVSEALFALTTNGGAEFCGYVINASINQLQWSQSNNDIKAIFIAGNEPFTQGPVAFEKAVTAAKAKGVTVNTIYAGGYTDGEQSGWKQGALLAGGNYMSIDHNQKIAHIVAPQDQQIAKLNEELNKTYVPYGAEGQQSLHRQQAQDSLSSNISAGLMAKRAKTKASSFYDNSSWDLVDAAESDDFDLEAVAEPALPAEMQEMDTKERKNYIEAKKAERSKIKKEIAALSKARDEFVANEKRKSATAAAPTLDEAMISAVRKQGEAKNFKFN